MSIVVRIGLVVTAFVVIAFSTATAQDETIKICTILTEVSNAPAATPEPTPDPGFDLVGPTDCKWGKNTLTVRFLDGQQVVKERVINYANEWSKYTNMKFVFVNSGNADIRISFRQQGSWSYIGQCLDRNLTQNDPTMNFGWLTPDTFEQEYSRVVLHEFGHALGFAHEHQHPLTSIPWNVQAVYNYYKLTQNWDAGQVDRNIFRRYSTEETNFSQYDQTSIMHYSIPNSLTNGDFETPWNTQLSNIDKDFVGKWYPYYLESQASGDFKGQVLAVDGTSGKLIMTSNRRLSGAGWRIVKSGDIVRFQSLAEGKYYGQYLDVSTTSGAVKLYSDASHTGTKWLIVNEGKTQAIISSSSGDYNGKRLTLSTTNGTIWMEGSATHTGTRWLTK